MKLRILAAAAVLVSAAVHLKLWVDVFQHTHVVGPAFIVNAIGGTIIAVLLVIWRRWIPLLLAVGFGASTLGAFIIAATVGLYGVHEHWTGWEVWTAAATEIVAIVAAGTVLIQKTLLRQLFERGIETSGILATEKGVKPSQLVVSAASGDRYPEGQMSTSRYDPG